MITFYTDRLIPERFGAVNFGPISLIRPKYKNDAGLKAHEAIHAAQWMMMAAIGPVCAAIVYLAQIEAAQPYLLAILLAPSLFHGLLYKFLDKYRQACEVAAYKAQLKCTSSSASCKTKPSRSSKPINRRKLTSRNTQST